MAWGAAGSAYETLGTCSGAMTKPVAAPISRAAPKVSSKAIFNGWASDSQVRSMASPLLLRAYPVSCSTRDCFSLAPNPAVPGPSLSRFLRLAPVIASATEHRSDFAGPDSGSPPSGSRWSPEGFLRALCDPAGHPG